MTPKPDSQYQLPKNETAYKPNPKELVITQDPDDPKVTTLAFVVRQATWHDKVKFILRMKSKLASEDIMEKRWLRSFFKNEENYLCIEDEEVTVINGNFILGLAQDEVEVPSIPEEI